MHRSPVIVAIMALTVACNDIQPTPSAPTQTPGAIALSSSPSVILRSGSSVTVTAEVRSTDGIRVNGETVEFSTSAGALSTRFAQTDPSGLAKVTLTGSEAATVRASAAGFGGAVQVPAVAPFTLSVAPTVTPVVVGTRAMLVTTTPAAGIVSDAAPASLTLTCASGVSTLTPGSNAIGSCTFSSPGTYSVTAAATTANGWSTSTSVALTIVAEPTPAPAPAPPAQPLHATIGCVSDTTLTVSCNVESVSYAGASVPSGRISSVVWDFGDGHDITSGATQTHLYDQPGTFSVRAVVTVDTADGLKSDVAFTPVTVPKPST